MAQRFCNDCGAAIEANQRFCSNCGSAADPGTRITERSSGDTPLSPQEYERGIAAPPPPPSTNPPQRLSQSYTPPSFQAPTPGPGYQPPPIYQAPTPQGIPVATPHKSRVGRGIAIALLIILGICGAVGYFGYQLFNQVASTFQDPSTGGFPISTSQNPSSGSGNDTGTTPVVTKLDEKSATVIYAGVKMTIVSAEQSLAPSNGSDSAGTGLLRLNLREENVSGKNAGYYFRDAMRLLLPDGTVVTPDNGKEYGYIDAAVVRENWVEFKVPNSFKLDQLILRLGTADEAQMEIPLTGNADLSKYATKTVQPNKAVTYEGPTWTLTEASMQWSAYGKQAEKGKIFVVVKMRVDNNSSKWFIANCSSYMRLKSGDTSAATSGFDLPSTIEVGQTGVAGTCGFMMPQGSTDFTLIMLKDKDPQDASITFEIP